MSEAETMPEDSRGDELLAACLTTLINHFDSVRIVVTSHEENKSEMKSVGGGNLYAQRGSVVEWLELLDAPQDVDE